MAAEIDCSCCCSAKDVLLVNFSNGRLKNEARKRIKFDIKHSQSKDRTKRDEKTVTACTKQMKYIGENFGVHACRAPSICKYYLGVLNKSTGKMRIVEAPLMNMRPHIAADEESQAPEIQADLNLSFREKNDRLTSAFGSSKKKRAMETRLRNQVKGEALEMALGVAVDHAMANPNATKVNSPVKSAETSSLIPPYDKEATSPADVYKLSYIVSEKELDAMAMAAQVFVESTRDQIQEWRKEEKYSKYVLDHVAVLPLREESRRRKAALLMYLQYMITLYQLRAPQLRGKDPLPPSVPDLVKKELFEKFTLQVAAEGRKTTRCMPARFKDKLVSYILVLCLTIDEFQFDLGSIQTDLKIGQQRMITFVRALGCRFSISKKTESGVKSVTQTVRLEVPLTFPEFSEKKKKNRR